MGRAFRQGRLAVPVVGLGLPLTPMLVAVVGGSIGASAQERSITAVSTSTHDSGLAAIDSHVEAGDGEQLSFANQGKAS